jgi:hypothetical protein
MNIDDVLRFKAFDRHFKMSDCGLNAIAIIFQDEYRIYTDCLLCPCTSESGFCGWYEGISATGNAVVCSRDGTEEMV